MLVSERFWNRYLGSRPDLSRTTLAFEGDAYAVVGVLPATIDFPVGSDLWVVQRGTRGPFADPVTTGRRSRGSRLA